MSSSSPTSATTENNVIIKPALKSSNTTNAPKLIAYHPNPNPKAIANSRYFGGFSFESESLPDFSEFEDNSDSAGAQSKRYLNTIMT
jgi:hypothetical protein